MGVPRGQHAGAVLHHPPCSSLIPGLPAPGGGCVCEIPQIPPSPTSRPSTAPWGCQTAAGPHGTSPTAGRAPLSSSFSPQRPRSAQDGSDTGLGGTGRTRHGCWGRRNLSDKVHPLLGPSERQSLALTPVPKSLSLSLWPCVIAMLSLQFVRKNPSPSRTDKHPWVPRKFSCPDPTLASRQCHGAGWSDAVTSDRNRPSPPKRRWELRERGRSVPSIPRRGTRDGDPNP